MDDYGLSAAQAAYDRQEPKEAPPKMHCDYCGAPLFEGDAYYDINGKMCERCLEEIRRYA